MSSTVLKALQRCSFLLLTCLACAVEAAAPPPAVAYPTADRQVRPVNDPFYVMPPGDVLQAAQPGQVLRYRPLPASSLPSSAKNGWHLMYRSSDNQGRPTAMVTTLMTPAKPRAGEPRLISYQSFYDSLTLQCTPSNGILRELMFESTFYTTPLKHGLHLVISDFEGLSSQWAAGPNSAHGVLDGLRAALHFEGSKLPLQTPIGLYGYSGGGFASAWSAELAGSYAPELNIVGAALGGTPVDITNTLKKLDDTNLAGGVIGAMVGLWRAHPELALDTAFTAEGRKALADAGTRCMGGVASGNPDLMLKYMNAKISSYFKDPGLLNTPVFQAVNRFNSLGQNRPSVPLYMWEGSSDPHMDINEARGLMQNYCAQGVKVRFQAWPGLDHVFAVTKLNDALAYIEGLLDGTPAASDCP